MLIGALLRYPAREVQRRLVQGLNQAGFDDLRLPHMAVLQYPGPDGVRPTVLAERAGMSKQAMNQLLMSLERMGYITRQDAPEGGRARIVRFTERGHAAWALIHVLLLEVEDEWREALGDQRFAELKEILLAVWESPLVRGEHEADNQAPKQRRAELQRETLLQLQDCLHQLLIQCAQDRNKKLEALRKGGEWPAGAEGYGYVSEQAFDTWMRAVRLNGRVVDAHVRSAAHALLAAAFALARAPSRHDADEALIRAGELRRDVNDRIGEVLRTL
jgi:DNA-binding MarR family transcriptional regulator